MRYIEFIEHLQKFTGKKIKDTDIARILNITPQATHQRKVKNTTISDCEIALVAKTYDIEPIVFKQIIDESGDELVFLKEYTDISAALGNGREVLSENDTQLFPIPRVLLKTIGASIQDSSIIHTNGDSMYPTIIGGCDKILVDTSKTDIYDGKIYVIRLDNSILAKRLQKLPGGVLKIISDNPTYESYNIDLKDESLNFQIIGRILWLSRKFS